MTGRRPRLPLMLALAAMLLALPVTLHAQGPPSTNAPWYPSMQAFEHYDSGHSHVFALAPFGGTFRGRNTVTLQRSADGAYPSGYNTSYLNRNSGFIQGGSYGNLPGSIGPFVAKFDQKTLKPVWYTQLRNTVQADEWDYPGGMAIESDGFIYVVSGYRLFKVNPADGKVVDTLVLPTQVNMRNNYPNTPATFDTTTTDDAKNTSYNGINALPDGTIVVKSLYRQAGCTDNGPAAIITCPETRNVPQSILGLVDPKTMKMVDSVTLAQFAGARPTVTTYKGVVYVYLVEGISTVVRYAVTNGKLTLDTGWTPAAVPYPDQTSGGTVIVIGDWIVGATNSVPAAGPLTMFAINQGDASKIFLLQPYANERVPPLLKAAFKTAAAGNTQAISWAGMSLEADPENGLVYGVETLTRSVAAFKITSSGWAKVWEKRQTTTEWATLTGPKNRRVWVGTEIPPNQIPGANTTERIIWRDAATGRLLATSPTVPQMTQGSAVQPAYGGSVIFPTGTGQLIRATPRARRAPQRPRPKPKPKQCIGCFTG